MNRTYWFESVVKYESSRSFPDDFTQNDRFESVVKYESSRSGVQVLNSVIRFESVVKYESSRSLCVIRRPSSDV